VFEKFEDARERVNIEGYSVGQTTLEQIFNQVSITRARVQPSKRGFTHSFPFLAVRAQLASSQENPEVAAAKVH
jgi:hypothetical protein